MSDALKGRPFVSHKAARATWARAWRRYGLPPAASLTASGNGGSSCWGRVPARGPASGEAAFSGLGSGQQSGGGLAARDRPPSSPKPAAAPAVGCPGQSPFLGRRPSEQAAVRASVSSSESRSPPAPCGRQDNPGRAATAGGRPPAPQSLSPHALGAVTPTAGAVPWGALGAQTPSPADKPRLHPFSQAGCVCVCGAGGRQGKPGSPSGRLPLLGALGI